MRYQGPEHRRPASRPGSALRGTSVVCLPGYNVGQAHPRGERKQDTARAWSRRRDHGSGRDPGATEREGAGSHGS